VFQKGRLVVRVRVRVRVQSGFKSQPLMHDLDGRGSSSPSPRLPHPRLPLLFSPRPHIHELTSCCGCCLETCCMLWLYVWRAVLCCLLVLFLVIYVLSFESDMEGSEETSPK
jgi:hypothetical protein